MKKIAASVLLFFMIVIISFHTHAQENSNPSIKLLGNNINIYVGITEYNVNYERNIIQRPKSYSNLRMGFGRLYPNLDGGPYINPSFVHLIGKNNKHLEVDLGFKYIVEKDSSNSFLPDIYAGYRYEKPSGGLIFRVGINLYTLYNIGLGIKF